MKRHQPVLPPQGPPKVSWGERTLSPQSRSSGRNCVPMHGDVVTDELEQTRRERDLYRRILDLGANDDIERFLSEVLGLVVDLTGAACGYIELYGPRGVETGG